MTCVRLRLEPMTERRFLAWTRETISGFVEQQVGAGAVAAREAREHAEREFDSLLSQGLFTRGHHVWAAYDGDAEVGYLWLGVRVRPELVEGYVYDVAVSPHLRSRGYGRALMLAGESRARELGISAMLLNVFGHNTVARRLYESLGYTVSVTHLGRRLDTTVPLASYGDPAVRLEPMTERQFAAYRGRAENHERLPIGPDATDQLFWTSYDGDTEVGMVWLSMSTRSDGRHAFGRDLWVDELWRHRGYARAIMVAAEQACRDRGVVAVDVDLDGPDHGARSSYEQMGFTVTATRMGKDLCDPREGSPEAEDHPR